MEEIEKDLILVKEIYKKTPYSQEYLSLLCRKERIKAKKIARKWFISKTALEEYIKEQGIPVFLPKESVSKSKLRHPIKSEILLTNSAMIAPPRPQIDFPGEIKIIKPEKEEIQEKSEQIIQRKDVEDIKSILDRFLKIIEARLFPKFFTFKPTARAIVLGCLMAGGLLGFAFANGGYQYAQGMVQEIKDHLDDALSVQGHFPGNGPDDILTLDSQGRIYIEGDISTEKQFVSFATDTPPFIVYSNKTVKNLSADFLDGFSSENFTLQFVTDRGNTTTNNIKLLGELFVGKKAELDDILIVKGKAEFLDFLSVLKDALVKGRLTVENNADITGLVKVTGDVDVSNLVAAYRGQIKEGGLVVSGHTQLATVGGTSASFHDLGIADDFNVGGDITLGTSGADKMYVYASSTFAERVNIAESGSLSVKGQADFTTLSAATTSISGPFTLSDILKLSDGTASAPSLTFSNDTDTGIFRPTSDYLSIATGGEEKIRLGVASSTMYFMENDDSSSATTTSYIFSTLSHTSTTSPKSYLAFATKETTGSLAERMRIDYQGKTGVSSTTPWGLLSVEHIDSGDELFSSFVVSDSGTSTPSLIVMNNNGFVGIATSTPGSRFSVQGDVLFSRGSLTNYGLLTTSYIHSTSTTEDSYFAGHLGIATTTPGTKLAVNNGNLDLGGILTAENHIKTSYLYSTSTSDSYFVGNLGIGDKSPDAALDVEQTFTQNAGVDYNIRSTPLISTNSAAALYGVYVQNQTSAEAITLTDNYGIFIENPTKGAGSTITTNYGLYISGQTSGNTDYAIYTNGGTIRFGDDINFGATTPTISINNAETLVINDGTNTLFSFIDKGDYGSLQISGQPTTHGGSWPNFTNYTDSEIYLNTTDATGDRNMLAIAKNSTLTFLIDSEGDIFTSGSVIISGTMTQGTTQITGDLRVEGSSFLGDSGSDIARILAHAHFLEDVNIYGEKISLGTGSATTTLAFANSLFSVSTDLDVYGGDFNLGTGTATSTLSATASSTFIGGISSDSGFEGKFLEIYSSNLYLGDSSATSTVTSSAGDLVLSAAGTNQNITLTPSGTGYTLLNGSVGIGTTIPSQTLHVVGQCVTGDTLLRRRKKRKKADGTYEYTDEWEEVVIKDIKGGEYVLSLNEKTGKLVPAEIKGLLDMGVKPIYKIETEDGRTIRTTGNHPYLAKNQSLISPASPSLTSNLSISETIINLPEKSLDSNFFNKFFKDLITFSKVGGRRENQIIPGNLEGGNLNESEKSASWVRMILSSFLAKTPTSISDNPLAKILTSWPSFLNHFTALNLKFSSAKNFMELFNQSSDSPYINSFGSIEQSSFDMAVGQRGIVFENFFNSFARSQHFQNQPDHNSGSSKTRLAATNLGINRNIFADVNSVHNNFNDNISKNDVSTGQWVKVIYLKEGDEIAVAADNLQNIKFVKIKRITELPPEQVYDIEVEGTHNFVGNGIIAHNTYITGNLGIATSTPGSLLSVQGHANLGSLVSEGIIKASYFISTSTTNSTFAGALDVTESATSTFTGGVNVSTTGGLSSASGLTITGGDILSSGKLTITSSATSSYSGGIITTGLLNSVGLISSQRINLTGTATSTFDSSGLSVGGGGLKSSAGFTLTGGDAIISGTLNVDGAGDSYFTGNVGIGTTGPNRTLDVNGPASIRGGLIVLSAYATGSNNIFIGSEPTVIQSGALSNLALGLNALDSLTTGEYNTALGYDALTTNAAGNNNTALGYSPSVLTVPAQATPLSAIMLFMPIPATTLLL